MLLSISNRSFPVELTTFRADKQAEGLMNQAFYPIDLRKDISLLTGKLENELLAHLVESTLQPAQILSQGGISKNERLMDGIAVAKAVRTSRQ
jgi:hypothetical protein